MLPNKVFLLIFWFLITIGVSLSWSSVINPMLKPVVASPSIGGLKPDLIESVANGAQMAIDECRNVFKWDRWNCPQSSFSRQFKQLSTKEKAYTEAIVAAGVVYSITKNCTRGELNGCGCNPNYRILIDENNKTLIQTTTINNNNEQIEKDWIWGGCSDDTTYGEQIVLKFLQNSNEKNGDLQAFINQHNNRIGRQIVRQSMVRRCRCHGVSGGCSLQTCWMQIPSFTIIAQELRNRYLRANRVTYNDLSTGNRIRPDIVAKLPNQQNLVYFDESPDYCFNNNRTGWSGTWGRICSRNTQTTDLLEKKSCKNLCRSCGYKVRKTKKLISYRCHCKFNWCCEVKCDICREHVDEYFCE